MKNINPFEFTRGLAQFALCTTPRSFKGDHAVTLCLQCLKQEDGEKGF